MLNFIMLVESYSRCFKFRPCQIGIAAKFIAIATVIKPEAIEIKLILQNQREKVKHCFH